MFCYQPFYYIEIYENGDVYTCCPSFIDNFSIGNIFKNNFDDIWNGEKIQKFRKKLLSGDLSLCSDNCLRKKMGEIKDKEVYTKVEGYPAELSISTDKRCNVKCRICRDNNIAEPTQNYEQELLKFWLPLFKDAKLVRFGCSGEPFASLKETALIKKISQKYPDIRYQFHTNGILGNKKKLQDLGVFEKIDIMTVSCHSASENTYNRVVIGGNYKKVMQNLKLYSEMKNDGLIKFFRMIFVVYSDNYKDMPAFAELAKDLGAQAQFWAYRKNDTEIGRNYDKYAIVEKTHPLHKNLVKILQKDIFKSDDIVLFPEIQSILNE